MGKNVLITGGAGFIGSHLADELLRKGYSVRALDNLSPQVHGPHASRPQYLDPRVDLRVGDVRDKAAIKEALDGIDAVYHFAAVAGVGQSMYEVSSYMDTNVLGTAVLLEALIRKPVERFVVASSMSVYGEGLYLGPGGSVHADCARGLAQLKSGDWEVRDSLGNILRPAATPETKPPCFASVYALSKHDQEVMSLVIGRTYNIPVVALRFFNCYGPRQTLSNPYTGVLAIFASRLLNDHSPLIFEDGHQKRDFVSVHDVARACVLALEAPGAPGNVFNIASGQSITIHDLAYRTAKAIGRENIAPTITGQYRAGDIRHCFADISRARRVLDYNPQVTLEAGLTELAAWLSGQLAHDRSLEAVEELTERGLRI